MGKWHNWRRYENGTPMQHKMYQALDRLQIMDTLAPWEPVVIGTIPLDIDIPGSDIDIALYVDDFDQVEQVVRQHFSQFDGFRLERRVQTYRTVLVCQFFFDGFEIELYGENRPTECQNGYRHMVIESRFLDLAGTRLRDHIRQLKLNGLKTEPAFAEVLGIEDDPYDSLLMYYHRSDSAYLSTLSHYIQGTQHQKISDTIS